jgi:hypothetical protein
MSAELVITSEGACLLGGALLHPSQDPLEAARQELAGLLRGAGPEDTLVLAGAGLGWHARAALEEPRGPAVVVFEPDPERRAWLRSLGPSLAGAEIATDIDSLVEILSRRLVYGGSKRVAIFAPPAYQEADPELVAQTRQVVQQVISRSQTDHLTRQQKLQLWLDNLAENFKYVLEVPDVTQLVGALQGVPAVVIGAGPSLDRSLPELARAGRHALLLAAASALGPMRGAGLAPHFALAMEGRDESRQFGPAPPPQTMLLAATSGHPNHFRRWYQYKGLFHLHKWVVDLVGRGVVVPSGGHATSAAFSLAVLWGCDPIVLVGQDLAYTGGRIHASGRPGGEDEPQVATVEVAAIGGGSVRTSPVMQSYISWYQEAAAYLRTLAQPPRVINATAAGALLPGFEHRPLSQVLAGLPELDMDFERVLQVLARLPRPQGGGLVQRLLQAKARVRQVARICQEAGLEAAHSAAGRDTPAAEVLAGLPPEAGGEQAKAALDHMSAILQAMAEGLYA